jgi:hypothetical protein
MRVFNEIGHFFNRPREGLQRCQKSLARCLFGSWRGSTSMPTISSQRILSEKSAVSFPGFPPFPTVFDSFVTSQHSHPRPAKKSDRCPITGIVKKKGQLCDTMSSPIPTHSPLYKFQAPLSASDFESWILDFPAQPHPNLMEVSYQPYGKCADMSKYEQI